MRDTPNAASFLSRATPFLFVVLWASGFVVAKLVRPYAEPETFVALRFGLSALLLAGIALIGGASWPSTRRGWVGSLAAGALMQGVYVCGVFWSIKNGLPASVAALISGLQPLLTGALAGPLLGERVSGLRWLGILVGFAGALLVLAPNLGGASAVPPLAILACFTGMAGITFGTILQKRVGATVDLRSGATIQFIGGFLVALTLALCGEHLRLTNHHDLWIGLAWGVIVLSVFTSLLLLRLIKHGAVAQVTALFYLAPPVTALMALALFGESLVPAQIVGMGVAAAGVAIANRG